MTKVQLKESILSTLTDNNASKKLSAAVIELLEQYTATKSATPKREKVITVDGAEFAYCTKHNVYEPVTNFGMESDRKGGKRYNDGCRLANLVWKNHTKEINQGKKELSNALDAEDYESAAKLNKEIKSLELQRGGRYAYEQDMLNHVGIEDYNYNDEDFIAVDADTKED